MHGDVPEINVKQRGSALLRIFMIASSSVREICHGLSRS